MERQPTTQDLTWFIDHDRHGQLNTNPSYQRRSVWTRKDRLFFLDTIFRKFPSPAIFLHKTIDENGRATYHVVDGKQRIETVLQFVQNKIRLSSEFGDNRLDGKKWEDLPKDLKQVLWNYQVTVEMIDIVTGDLVNEIFDRLNRNSVRLNRQELRHAKYHGWLIEEAENEVEQVEWSDLKVSTRARARRMLDVQFMSELMFVILEMKILGFDQNAFDILYAKYEDPIYVVDEDNNVTEIDPDDFRKRLRKVRDYIVLMESHNQSITKHAKTLGHFYSLWGVIALNDDLAPPDVSAERYDLFMKQVSKYREDSTIEETVDINGTADTSAVTIYAENSRGAITDLAPRMNRHRALESILLT